MINQHKRNDYELIKVESGDHFHVSESDISFFTLKTKEQLEKLIKPKDKIALFLPLDQMSFSQLIIYKACQTCNAAVIRCTFADLERQIPVIHGLKVDYVIASGSSLKYIAGKVNYGKAILFEGISQSHKLTGETGEYAMMIYDFYDIPAFMILDQTGKVACPGYEIHSYDGESLTISSSRQVEGFSIGQYKLLVGTGLSVPSGENAGLLSAGYHFILNQLMYLLSNKYNINFEDNDIVLDSLGMIEVLVYIEDEFGLSIPVEGAKTTDFSKLDQLTSFILQLLREGERKNG